MTRLETLQKVVQRKQRYPEKYCSDPKCLYRTDELHCPRHRYKIIHKAINQRIHIVSEKS